jgi:hypothetical protein
MENSENTISNLDLPVAQVIRGALNDLAAEIRAELLDGLSEDDFISHRVDIYLTEIEAAMHSGLDELGSKEIALQACLAGLTNNHG